MSCPPSSDQEARGASLLIINPNTNSRVTGNIRAAVERVIAQATTVRVVNPAEGPFAIENEADRDIAEPHVLALVRESLTSRPDAYVLAAFDDIGLSTARGMVAVPVVGAVEAGIAAARTMGRRFSIVTTVEAALPGIRAQLARHGAADIATARAAGIGVAEAADGTRFARERLLRAIDLAVRTDGADAIMLGSGGLTGCADMLRNHTSVPIVDAVLAAVKMAEALAPACQRSYTLRLPEAKTNARA
ncbi:aspartate/glutamate racemase family protein [Ancylobacter defluvii]|uniref:Asp/Glu/hydantoin racemase n=1 Tax=Ancylobacter defluvii TaxID=1282440 RepID=A0A9W6NCY3_9HYPH|nr:aspartate/glutamate racemase family protein [Ancylobacter defluvii]MBS7586851.1 Asp/Glu racemase [Ancylobacter defluvii]GLK86157.1 Asp/Glu/hydantoin racemase [Ancylobacter defluvii]